MKLDNKTAFSSPIENAEKKQDDQEAQEQKEQPQDQDDQDPQGQEQYQEPSDDEIMSPEEIDELVKQLQEDGVPVKQIDAIINEHMKDMKGLHKKMHESGQDPENMDEEDSNEASQEPTEGQDPNEDVARQAKEGDGANITEQSNAQPAPNDEIVKHYMKMHADNQKHIHSVLSSLAGAQTK